jgi:hypothetical protein
MSWGQSNLVRPDSGAKILYRGTLNTYGNINATGLTVVNLAADAQAQANTTISTSTPNGILSGAVIAVTSAGTVGLANSTATGVQTGIVGIAVNNATGNVFESASAVGSGKVTYLHGTNSVIAVDKYETANTSGVAIDYSVSAGYPVYASQHGLLTIAAGLTGGAAGVGATIVGIVLDPPTATNPLLVVQLRI